MLNIRKETDYSKFNLISGNRPVQVKELLESIQEKNLLESHPILVTKDFEIIDGQHRLECARILRVPIYYIVDENLDEDDIPRCQVQKNWKVDNFLEFYKRYKPDYEFVKEIVVKNKLLVHFVVSCCSHETNPYRSFNKGKFSIKKDKNKLRKLFQLIEDVVNVIKESTGAKISRNALNSIWTIVSSKDYDHDIMLHKCKVRKEKVIEALEFRNQKRITETLLEKVYNYKRSKSNQEEAA